MIILQVVHGQYTNGEYKGGSYTVENGANVSEQKLKGLQTVTGKQLQDESSAINDLTGGSSDEQGEEGDEFKLKTPEAEEIDSKITEMQESIQNSDLFATLQQQGMLGPGGQKQDDLLASGGASAPLDLQTKVRLIVKTVFGTPEIKKIVKHFEVIASYSSKILKIIKTPAKGKGGDANAQKKAAKKAKDKAQEEKGKAAVQAVAGAIWGPVGQLIARRSYVVITFNYCINYWCCYAHPWSSC